MTNKSTANSDMILESNRLSTFINWPFNSSANCTAEKMAEAGFYSCGGPTEPDAVACFLCGKELDGWEESDDPWKEHRSHAKQCMFVQIGKPESEMTFKEFFEVFQQYDINKINSVQKKHIETFDEKIKIIKSNIIASKLSN